MKLFVAAAAASLAILAVPAQAQTVSIDFNSVLPVGEYSYSGAVINATGASFGLLFTGMGIDADNQRLYTGSPVDGLSLQTVAGMGTLGLLGHERPNIWLSTPQVNAPMVGNPNFSAPYAAPLSVLLDQAASSFTFTIKADGDSSVKAALFGANGELLKTETLSLGTLDSYTLSSEVAFQGVTFYDNSDLFGVSYAGMSYNVAAVVPEPETYGMMLLGLGLVGAIARRRAARRA